MKTDSVKYISPVTWLLRLIIGGVFVFSGFVKAIDPWGTLYKVNDYLGVMSLSLWPNLVLVGVFGLCALEFVTGIFLLTGCFRRSGVIMAALIMAFMLPLSLWIAIGNPVDDCGCFGDAFVISNWATFWKNVALTAGIIWLIRFNKLSVCLITPALQWIALVVSGVFVIVIELFGYNAQPLLDFRQYKIGEKIIDSEAFSEYSPRYVFIYERNGERREYTEDDVLPDENEGWVFIDRKEVPSDEKTNGDAIVKDAKNFRVWSKDGEDDETNDAIVQDGKEFLVMMPDLKEVSPATTWKLNSLYEWSLKNDIYMIAVVSGSPEEIAEWEDLSMASYPIYTADDTQIKEVVRGNPGVVYLEDGNVVWKNTLNAINIDDFLQPDADYDARDFSFDSAKIIRNICYVYLIIMAVLVVLSFTPRLHHIYTPKKRKGKFLDATEVSDMKSEEVKCNGDVNAEQ